MEVLGRDSVREAYRLSHGGLTAVLPDTVISASMPLTGGHGHRTAYEWIARHQGALEDAIEMLGQGRQPPAPFDRMDLLKEHD